MKRITLESLQLKNFMGLKDFTLDADNKNLSVYADNGVGKTTIFNAFTWLLFDKDSHDASKFTVQPLDSNNNIVHMVDTEVTGVLNIDGSKVTLRKVLKEKWVKKRGETESELKGTECSYFCDDTPMKQGEYKAYISNIIDENVFKLITNPMYFSTSLTWQDRRKVLMDIIGDFDDSTVISYKPELQPLAELLHDKSMDDLKKSIAFKKKKLNDDIKAIPVRIDECVKTIDNSIDFDALDFQKRSIVPAIKEIEEQLLNNSKSSDTILKKKDNLYRLRLKLQDIEHKAQDNAMLPKQKLRDRLLEISQKIYGKHRDIDGYKYATEENKKDIENLKKQKNDLYAKYDTINNEKLEFNDNQFICPTCKRPFEADDIEKKKAEMQENFNRDKAKKLEDIKNKGLKINALIAETDDAIKKTAGILENAEKQINDLTAEKQKLEEQVNNFMPTTNFDNNPEYQDISEQIVAIVTELSQSAETNTQTAELKERKEKLENELQKVNSKLAKKDTNDSLKKRVEELKKQQRDLVQQYADLEKQEELTEKFIKAKVELLESSINSKFRYVSFKLFENQVNGGLKECCEPLVNGIPFGTNLNSGARINAGIDIINTLCNYYQISAPIFVDNSETVTKLISTESQMIRLVVSAKDKQLRVEVNE